MKKTLYLFASLYLISLIYASVQSIFLGESFFLIFLNVIGIFSIILLIVLILLLLSGSGYFDVFGYTFKKTYLMFTNKVNKMDIENQEKYRSYYDYGQFKSMNRLKIKFSFTSAVLFFILFNFILSVIYSFYIN